MEVAGLAAVPVRLHGGDLDRLVLERVEPVLVAEEQLQRREDRGQPDRHAQHGARLLDVPAGEQVARADREHDEGRREEGGVDHVGEAVGKLGLKTIASQSSG